MQHPSFQNPHNPEGYLTAAYRVVWTQSSMLEDPALTVARHVMKTPGTKMKLSGRSPFFEKVGKNQISYCCVVVMLYYFTSAK